MAALCGRESAPQREIRPTHFPALPVRSGGEYGSVVRVSSVCSSRRSRIMEISDILLLDHEAAGPEHEPAPGAGDDGASEIVLGARCNSFGASVFDDRVERALAQDAGLAGWLTTFAGVSFQFSLCGLFVFASVYESVFKSKAVIHGRATGEALDPASIPINAAIVSLIMCFATATARREWRLLFNDKTLQRMALFAFPSALFSLSLYVEIMVLSFISADVFKALEQSRLLVTALLSRYILVATQSWSEWNGLVLITFAAVGYMETKKLEGQAIAEDGALAGAPDLYAIGIPLTMLAVGMQSLACLLSERLCKSEKFLPFYVQKFFIELWGLLFGLMMSGVLNPIMLACMHGVESSFGINLGSSLQSLEGNYFRNPLHGWSCVWAVVMLCCVTMKSWLTGLIIKRFSSVAKQCCSVTAMGITYFAVKLHVCERRDIGTFFCWGQMSTITVPMVVADVVLMLSVVSYVLAKRAHAKRISMQGKLRQAEQALVLGASGTMYPHVLPA
eukprot:CAMPEP_0176020304 /NCGR_PEP_ID=MMETSP0120_2-20121206/9832_1 /TAXON_ID=160619 /ORGANISM="Kryptoperidinium foliaceum, Strain CCMP 1326" /LENGTH=504 /DNA_ID=CAMNT_0017353397 /DNA_START=93 /DNA_END=1607 /DNA_ORIENTATION=-